MPDTDRTLAPDDCVTLFHSWETIVEDEHHPLYAEACLIAASPASFKPGALFCELVEAT